MRRCINTRPVHRRAFHHAPPSDAPCVDPHSPAAETSWSEKHLTPLLGRISRATPQKQKAAAAVGEVIQGHGRLVHHQDPRHHRSHLFHCKITRPPAFLASVRRAMWVNIDVLMVRLMRCLSALRQHDLSSSAIGTAGDIATTLVIQPMSAHTTMAPNVE